VGKRAQTAISTRPVLQRNEWLLKQLMVLAEARGAEVSSECFELYATALAEFPDEEIQAVILKVAKKRRGEFEKPWPALGDLLEPLEMKQQRRREAEQEKRRRAEQVADFWRVVNERMEQFGEFRINGVDCHTADEVNEVEGSYKGTKPR